MKIIFPVMGAENISVAVMATLCKDLGHSVKVAFDRALFDDKQYFSIGFLANLFDKKKQVIEEIIKEKPDVLALSVFSDNYQWSLDLVRRVKEKHKNFVTVWGGIHPTSVPGEVIKEDAVDFVIEGDGELPMTKLLHALENGKVFEDVPNLWFKKAGEIFSGKHTYLNEEGSFPIPDKNVFENFIPMEEYYLTVTNKGCIQKCSFCSENFKFDHEAELREGSFIREKSVDTVIQELKEMKERYKLRYIDIKNNVLSGSKKWISEFCEKYPKEVGLPFRVMVQPLQLQSQPHPP